MRQRKKKSSESPFRNRNLDLQNLPSDDLPPSHSDSAMDIVFGVIFYLCNLHIIYFLEN